MNPPWSFEHPLNLVLLTMGTQTKPITEETLAFLESVLKDLAVPYRRSENELDAECLNILVGVTCFLHPDFVSFIRNKRYIVYQLEPLSTMFGVLPRHPHYLDVLRHAALVWDYSLTNSALLRAQGIERLVHLPFGYHSSLNRLTPLVDKDIDVIFCGSLLPRRVKLLNELRAHGLRVETPLGVFGEARNALIERAKIQLNIHQEDHLSILEEQRMSFLLANRCFVISETSDHDPFEGSVVFCPYDEIVTTCLKYLSASADERDLIAARGQAALMKRPMTDLLQTALMRSCEWLMTPSPPVKPRLLPNNVEGCARAEIIARIPADAHAILAIGRATGRLGHSLKQRQACHVTALELDPDRIEATEAMLDTVYHGDIPALIAGLPDDRYDAVIVADVLDYVVDTEALLSLLRAKLAPRGCLLLSVSNIRHESVFNALLEGDWPYDGIVNSPRVRCFTLKSLARTLANHDFYIARAEAFDDEKNQSDLGTRLAELDDKPEHFLDETGHRCYLLACRKELIDGTDETDALTARALLHQASHFWRIGMTHTALKTYRHLADNGKRQPETWLACFQVARLGEHYTYISAAEIIAYYLRAYEFQPRRAEPLVNLARIYRMQGSHALAHLYAGQAIMIPKPERALAVDESCYDWRALDEYAVACSWLGDYRASANACRRLLDSSGLPDEQRQRVSDNLNWVLQQQKNGVQEAGATTAASASQRARPVFMPAMTVSQIAQHWINQNRYQSLLELRKVAASDFGSSINIAQKEIYCIDHQPWLCCISQQTLDYIDKHGRYFDILNEDNFETLLGGRQWDIILFDVYHTRDCVKLWLNRCIPCLSPNGVLLMHDVSPQRQGDVKAVVDMDRWCGETYKIWMALCRLYPDDIYSVNEGFGVGLGVIPGSVAAKWNPDWSIDDTLTWDEYIRNRTELTLLRDASIFPSPVDSSAADIEVHTTVQVTAI